MLRRSGGFPTAPVIVQAAASSVTQPQHGVEHAREATGQGRGGEHRLAAHPTLG